MSAQRELFSGLPATRIPSSRIRIPESPTLNAGQQKIMDHVREHGLITLAEAVELVGGNLYCNAGFHVGNKLSRMVKRGLLRRVKKGVFEAGEKK